MGRPSKLAPHQWDQIQRRLLAGEGASALGREFGVDEAIIRRRFGHSRKSESPKEVQNAARLVAEAGAALDALPPMQRQVALTLAEELREISRSLAAAARLGSQTAAVLAAKAHQQAATVVDVDGLRAVAALTRTANEAAHVGLQLLRTNEDKLREEEAERQRQAEQVTRIQIVPMQPLPSTNTQPQGAERMSATHDP